MAALPRKLPKMEKQSENSPSRRRRNNRPQGGGNRNRNRNRNRNSGGNRGGNQNRGGSSRNRSRNRSRSRRAPKQTKGQKILSVLTFGLLGKPKPKSQPKRKPQEPKQTERQKARAQQADSPKPKKKRARTEVTSCRLYVGNLSYDTTENELEELFRGIGNVTSAEVVTNSRTQQSKGFAFVEMGSIDEAKRAVEILDDEDFMGRKLIVSGARSEGPRESDGDDSKTTSEAPKEENTEASQA